MVHEGVSRSPAHDSDGLAVLHLLVTWDGDDVELGLVVIRDLAGAVDGPGALAGCQEDKSGESKKPDLPGHGYRGIEVSCRTWLKGVSVEE